VCLHKQTARKFAKLLWRSISDVLRRKLNEDSALHISERET